MAAVDASALESFVRQLERTLLSLARGEGQGGAEAQAVAAARTRARELAEGAGGGLGASELGVLVFVAEVLSALASERPLTRGEIRWLVEETAELTELPPEIVSLAAYLRLVGSPRLLGLPPESAIDALLRVLYAFTSVIGLSLWTRSPEGPLRCLRHLGQGSPTRRVRQEARSVLQGLPAARSRERGTIYGIAVPSPACPAALVLRVPPEDRARSLALAEEAALALALPLDKRSVLERNAERESALLESSERRLVRVGLDLHDGAIQDVVALAGDVRLFRQQLRSVLATDEHVDQVLGRVDDLQARLLALHADLRELARSFESPSIASKPFAEALRDEVEAFRDRAGIKTTLEVRGDPAPLTPSQRIAVIRIVREALANVGEHSGASEARVCVTVEGGAVRATVKDDGKGFSVERTLVQAAKKGRLGLIGMSERARLLGGQLDVQSRPGGPTTISVSLPAWPAPSGEQA